MKAIVLEHPGLFTLQEMPMPEIISQKEALVRVRRVGICGTDLHAFEGSQPFLSYPRILGHELAVEVVALGEEEGKGDIALGSIAAVNPYINCGTCIACRRGRSNACVHMQVLGVHRDGGMAEYMVVPLHKLHDTSNLPLESVALVEMLSIGAHATRRARIEDGDVVLVIGAGPIGMGTMEFARLRGAQVIAMDVNADRLAFCRDVLKIPHTINALDQPVQAISETLGDEFPTTVFDATGNARSMLNAFQYVAHGGQLVYIGITKDDISFSDSYFHSREMTLLASRNALDDDFVWVIDSLSSGAIRLDQWITHETTPQRMIEEFAFWLKPETAVLKAMLSF